MPMSTADDRAAAESGPGAVVCIGVFDGVHRGHQALVRLARQRADARGLPLVIVTFDPHPLSVVGPRSAPATLATLDARIALLLGAGADEVDVLTFDHELAGMLPDEFAREILVSRLNVREIVVGENFRYGRGASGTVDTLRAEGARWEFEVTASPLTGGGTRRWSSTYARGLIADGDVEEAAAVLGRLYRLDGIVVHGDHRGRGLGFPTANLHWADAPTIPADGVYAGWLDVLGERLPAAVSVGTNPQFAGVDRRVESFVLDRDDLDLYGRDVGVEFAARIRGQQTFPTLDDFIARMGADVEQARSMLAARE
jgi:riboflavin kinase/FMN adenylyltransferase